MPDIQTLTAIFGVHDVTTLLTVLASGTGVAVTLQLIKHFGKLHDAKKTVTVLLGALSFAASLADAVLQFSGQNPKLVVGHYFGSILAAAVIIHRFSVSPAYYKLTSYLQAVKDDKAAAAAYRAEHAAQAVAPVTPEALPHEFSLSLNDL